MKIPLAVAALALMIASAGAQDATPRAAPPAPARPPPLSAGAPAVPPPPPPPPPPAARGPLRDRPRLRPFQVLQQRVAAAGGALAGAPILTDCAIFDTIQY